MHILSVQSSARKDASVSRQLSQKLIDGFASSGATVTVREADSAIEPVSSTWTQAAYKPEDQRTPEEKASLAQSDELVAELQRADVLVIGAPIYNFTVPAALKLWIDQVCRAGVTFRYTEDGPVGLLENKKAYVVVASGGTEVGSGVDFHTDYMRHVLGFIGIHDVEFISADQLMMKGEAPIEAANDQIARLTAA